MPPYYCCSLTNVTLPLSIVFATSVTSSLTQQVIGTDWNLQLGTRRQTHCFLCFGDFHFHFSVLNFFLPVSAEFWQTDWVSRLLSHTFPANSADRWLTFTIYILGLKTQAKGVNHWVHWVWESNWILKSTDTKTTLTLLNTSFWSIPAHAAAGSATCENQLEDTGHLDNWTLGHLDSPGQNDIG